jgi:SAM-dependent methyltransferase
MKNLIRKIRRKLIDNTQPLPKYYIIAEMLEKNKKVLDFGCWHGDLSKILIEKRMALITGCDLIEDSKFKNKNFKYKKVTTKNNFPFKEKFDYIIFADVLEHLNNPKEILTEAVKHTKNCVVSIPNLDFFLFKLFPKLENPPIELTPHLNHWTLSSFKKLLPQEIKIKRVEYCSDFPEFRWTNYFPFKNKSFFNQTIIIEIERKLKKK